MSSKLAEAMARQLRLPTQGLMGWLTFQFLKNKNDNLEKHAARLSAIEPHHKVLEIGFGAGSGIEHALQYVRDGPGKIYGVDLSAYMVEKASAQLRKPILDGKVELGLGDVIKLPYSTDTFNRVFHCNCYYFWPSMQDALQEIRRVMKPGGMMVTALNLQAIKAIKAKGWLKYGNPDPVMYMCALESSGFKDVRMEHFSGRSAKYQAIFAQLPIKPDVEDNMSNATSKLDQSRGAHDSQTDPVRQK